MPPTVFARLFRFHQISPQKANPISGRMVSFRSFDLALVFFAI
jgi:hypothetical protein